MKNILDFGNCNFEIWILRFEVKILWILSTIYWLITKNGMD